MGGSSLQEMTFTLTPDRLALGIESAGSDGRRGTEAGFRLARKYPLGETAMVFKTGL